MRVVHISDGVGKDAGGVGVAVDSLVQELSRLGVDARFAAGAEQSTAALHGQLFAVRGARQLGYMPGLLRHLGSASPEVLHSHGMWMYSSLASAKAAASLDIPEVLSPHGMLDPWALRNARWKKRLAMSLWERRHVSGASCVHALCLAEATAIRAFRPRDPVVIIPNGVAIPDVADRQGHGAPGRGCRRLLFLGRLHPKKGLSNLIRAISHVRSAWEREDWRLLVAGWDQHGHRAELTRLAAELGISNLIEFHGPTFGEDKEALLRGADAFVLPSLSEGLPVAVLEAWSYRLPVLMTSACNIPAGQRHGAAIEVGSEPTSLQQGLVQLLALSERERAEMGQRGRELVERDFSWSHVAERFASLYGWLLGGGAPPAELEVTWG